MKLFIPLSVSWPLVRVFPVEITIFVREIRADIQFLRWNWVQTWLRQHHALRYCSLCDLRSNWFDYFRRRQPRFEMLRSVRVIERSFNRKLLILHRLDMSWYRFVPIDDSFLLVAKPLDFFLMFVPQTRSVIVVDGRFGPRYIISVKSSHK